MFVAGVARADVTSTIAAPFSGDIDLGGGKLIVEYNARQAGTATLSNWPMAGGEKFPVDLNTNFVTNVSFTPSSCTRVPVIRIPVSVKTVTADDFTTTTSTKAAADFGLANTGRIAGIHFEVETSGGVQTVYLARKHYLVQGYGMDSKGKANASAPGAWNGWDAGTPSGSLGVLDNTRYLNVASNFLGVATSNPLRTPISCHDWTLSTDTASSLTLIGTSPSSAMTMVDKSRNLTIHNLVLGPLGKLAFWAIGKGSAGTEDQSFHGNIIVETSGASASKATIAVGSASTSANVFIDADISGSGFLEINNTADSLNPTIYLWGDNSGFTGRMHIVGSSASKILKMGVNNDNALGGSADSSSWGITLQHAALYITNNIRTVCNNRAMVFKPNVEINVGSNITFEHCTQYFFESDGNELKKTGSGTFKLSGINSGAGIGTFNVAAGTLDISGGGVILGTFIGAGNLRVGAATTLIPSSMSTLSGAVNVAESSTIDLSNSPTMPASFSFASGTTLMLTNSVTSGVLGQSSKTIAFEEGSTIALNFSSTNAAPVLAFSGASSLVLPAAGQDPVVVKVSADSGLEFKFGSDYAITSGGKFPADAVTSGKVVLSGDSPAWAKLYVNASGNLAVKVADCFYIKIAGTEDMDIPVPMQWMVDNGIAAADDSIKSVAAALTENGANGIPVWQSYCLGLEPGNAKSVVLCEAAAGQPSDGKVNIAAKNLNVPAGLSGSGVAVTAYLERRSGGDWVPVGDGVSVAPGAGPVVLVGNLGEGDGTSFFA